MSGKLKFLSAMNVAGWMVVMPVLMVLLVSPFISFAGLPGSGVSDRTDSARMARIAVAPDPAPAAAGQGLAVAAAEAHARVASSGVSLAVLTDEISPNTLAGRIPGAAPIMVSSLRQVIASSGQDGIRRASASRGRSPLGVAATAVGSIAPAVSNFVLPVVDVVAPTAPVSAPVVDPPAPQRPGRPGRQRPGKGNSVRLPTPSRTAMPAAAPTPGSAPAPSTEQHPGAANRNERAPEKKDMPEQSQGNGRGRGRS